jgi:hypothetical protein
MMTASGRLQTRGSLRKSTSSASRSALPPFLPPPDLPRWIRRGRPFSNCQSMTLFDIYISFHDGAFSHISSPSYLGCGCVRVPLGLGCPVSGRLHMISLPSPGRPRICPYARSIAVGCSIFRVLLNFIWESDLFGEDHLSPFGSPAVVCGSVECGGGVWLGTAGSYHGTRVGVVAIAPRAPHSAVIRHFMAWENRRGNKRVCSHCHE